MRLGQSALYVPGLVKRRADCDHYDLRLIQLDWIKSVVSESDYTLLEDLINKSTFKCLPACLYFCQIDQLCNQTNYPWIYLIIHL